MNSQTSSKNYEETIGLILRGSKIFERVRLKDLTLSFAVS
jgi:hypothetical protein